MILSKLIINQLTSYFVKHFKMDKVMNYVFNYNELDDKTRILLPIHSLKNLNYVIG